MSLFDQPSFFDDDPEYTPGRPGIPDDADQADSGIPDFLLSEFDQSAAEAVPEVPEANESGVSDDPETSAAQVAEEIAVASEPEIVEPATQQPAPPPESEVPSPEGVPAELPGATVAESPSQPPPQTPESTPEEFAAFWGSMDASDFAATPLGAPTATSVAFADPGQDAVDSFYGPPRLDRPRLERAPLVAQWVWFAAGAALIVLVLVAVLAAGLGGAGNILVPKLTGGDLDSAKTALAGEGLSITVTERRFSATAVGTVLDQTPAAGTKVRAGQTVSVVVSAGSELFGLPNVVGDGLLLAQGQLQTRGLDVRVEPQPSQQPSNTVLASNPPAGTSVHTGDIVRLTVAAPGPTQPLLLPYDMSRVTVVIDPEPVPDAQTDITLDVARRLRSLIEASKGVVVSTRALADTNATIDVTARAQRASETTAAVAIGLSTSSVGAGGLTVFEPSPVLQFASQSARLASKISSDLASESGTVKSATSTTDTVLAAAKCPWCRVSLGSFGQREDVAKFGDSAWADSVARALYRAIASTYGRKTGSL